MIMKTLKRRTALALALCLIMSVCFRVPVHAEDTNGQTTLTTTVPECTYTFTIPADIDIAYNETEVTIGTVSVSNVEHLGSRVIRVLIMTNNYLTSTTNSEDKIFYGLFGENKATESALGGVTTTEWRATYGTASEIVADAQHISRYLTVNAEITENEWKNANPGTYKGSVVFTFSVCDE